MAPRLVSPLGLALVRLGKADVKTKPEELAQGLDLLQQNTFFTSPMYKAFLQHRFHLRVQAVQNDTEASAAARHAVLRELLDARELTPTQTASLQFAQALFSESLSKVDKLKALLQNPKARELVSQWPCLKEWKGHADFAVGGTHFSSTAEECVVLFKEWRRLGLLATHVPHCVGRALYTESQRSEVEVEGTAGECCFKELVAMRLSLPPPSGEAPQPSLEGELGVTGQDMVFLWRAWSAFFRKENMHNFPWLMWLRVVGQRHEEKEEVERREKKEKEEKEKKEKKHNKKEKKKKEKKEQSEEGTQDVVDATAGQGEEDAKEGEGEEDAKETHGWEVGEHVELAVKKNKDKYNGVQAKILSVKKDAARVQVLTGSCANERKTMRFASLVKLPVISPVAQALKRAATLTSPNAADGPRKQMKSSADVVPPEPDMTEEVFGDLTGF
ncbi:MAG: hypothetical protein GY772_31035 [bacterium]|nr:hypothetical protein [bacterium]